MSVNIEELKANLDAAQQHYNNVWASDIDIRMGYMQGKIRWDLKLESAGNELERARNAYNDAME